MSRSVKRAGFEEEVAEGLRRSEAMYGPLKKITPVLLPSKLEPWMLKPGDPPAIFGAVISTPGVTTIYDPIPESKKKATLYIKTYFRPGVINRDVPVAPSVTTNSQGQAQLNSFEGQTITIGIPGKGGSIGEGREREYPVYAARSWGFKLRPGNNTLDLFTRPGIAVFNGLEVGGAVDTIDIDPQVVLPHAPTMHRGRGGLRP